MSGLENTVNRSIQASKGKGWKTSGEQKREKAAKRQKALDELYAGAERPDEEDIKRKERRKAAKRKGSRVETILTDDDTLG